MDEQGADEEETSSPTASLAKGSRGADVWCVTLPRGLAAVRDDLDFDETVLRQRLHCNSRARRESPRELLLIDRIHRSEVAHIGEETRGLDDLIDGEACFGEDGVDVAECLFGLCRDAFGELARRRINPELARCEEHISDTDGLAIRADGSRCLGGSNNLLHKRDVYLEDE